MDFNDLKIIDCKVLVDENDDRIEETIYFMEQNNFRYVANTPDFKTMKRIIWFDKSSVLYE